MPEVAAGGYCPGEDSASHAVCARALKLAAQYQNTNDVQQASALKLAAQYQNTNDVQQADACSNAVPAAAHCFGYEGV